MTFNPTYTGINIGQEFQSGLNAFAGYTNDTTISAELEAFIRSDIRYLKSLGFNKFRFAAPDYSWADRLTYQKKILEIIVDEGDLHLEWGVMPKNKPSEYLAWLAVLEDEALAFQEIIANGNNVTGGWKIGNENEAGFNRGREQLVSLTRTSNVVTVVMPTAHSMETGDTIGFFSVLSGSGDPILGINNNTGHTITKVNDTTFTFPSTGDDGTTDQGYIQYGAKTVRNIMKRQCTALKNAGVTLPISYSCIQGVATAQVGDYNIQDFVDEGREDLDYVDLNIYGTASFPVVNTLAGYFNDFKAEIQAGIDGFTKDHFRVTEWSGNSQVTSVKPASAYELRQQQENRLRYLEDNQIENYVFCWRQSLEGGAFTAVKPHNTNTGKTYRDWWSLFAGDKQRPGTKESSFSFSGTSTAISSLRESPLTVIDSNMGMNIGQYQQSGAAHSSAQLDQLWDLGIRKLRVASGNPSFSAGVTACQNLALAAKAKGFHVIFVFSGGDATDDNWDTIVGQVGDFAEWADSNGIDEINIFNEVDYRQTVAGVLTNSVDKQIAVATDLISAYPDLTISVAIAQSSMDYLGATDGWIEQAETVNNLGLKICYNVYGDNGNFEQFKERIDDLLNVYPDLRISEWSVNANWSNFPSSITDQNARIQEKFDFLQLRGLEHYFFTWNWDHANDQFALRKADGTLRAWKNVLFENPTPRTTASGRPVASNRPTIAIT